jgi:hypothetical protein
MFVIGRNWCKTCRNEKTRNDYKKIELSDNVEQKCNVCEVIKNIKEFHKGRKICCDCTSKKRRDKYENDETYRTRVKSETIKYKKSKNWIVDNPLEKLKQKVRSNIVRYLPNKSKRTMEYLGCSRYEYLIWLLDNKNDYTLENHGEIWHIDHVIPLSHFDLNDDKQMFLAFNWRNTMPLAVKDNLKKHNKIVKEQVSQHYENLKKYHEKHNLDLPQEFIDLFAKHLVDGNPSKPSLLLPCGNTLEDLG